MAGEKPEAEKDPEPPKCPFAQVRASEIQGFSTRCKQWLEDEQDASRNEEEDLE